MSTWARNANNSVVDVTTMDPSLIYYPTLAAQFIPVPDGTQNGWTWPVPVAPSPPPVQYRTLLTRAEYLTLFTSAERVAIRASTDAGVVDWLLLLFDPSAMQVDLTQPSIATALEYLVSKSLLTSDRPATILQGLQIS